MKLQYRLVICIAAFTQAFLGQPAQAKFKTGIAFSGGGLNIAIHLGMLDGIESQGVHPDVIVGTCGGSVAAAVVHLFPNSEQRRRFIESEEFQRFLTSPTPKSVMSKAEMVQLFLSVYYRNYWSDRLPDRKDYLQKIQAQWEWGRRRGIEAVRGKPKNDKSHIRNFTTTEVLPVSE